VAYLILTVDCEDGAPWEAQLMVDLEGQEVLGWTLAAMTTRTTLLPQTAGLGTVSRYGQQLVCVLHRQGRWDP
jgi:hypothetical protein